MINLFNYHAEWCLKRLQEKTNGIVAQIFINMAFITLNAMVRIPACAINTVSFYRNNGYVPYGSPSPP